MGGDLKCTLRGGGEGGGRLPAGTLLQFFICRGQDATLGKRELAWPTPGGRQPLGSGFGSASEKVGKWAPRRVREPPASAVCERRLAEEGSNRLSL